MTTDIGLTDEDFEKIRDIAENGAYKYMDNGGARTQTTPVTCHRCGYAWDYSGQAPRATCPVCRRKTPTTETDTREDGRGITTPMCHTIREAASDGLTYREIADLFNFINDATAVQRHATGACSHDDHEYPAVESKRDPGPVNPVDDDECQQMRDWYVDGHTLTDIVDATGRAKSTVYRHLNGDCSHWLHGL